MSDAPTLSLIVIRVSDIARSAEFYSAIGLYFQREQHGTGPEHYSASVGGAIFEIYPASERSPVTTSRIGFAVQSLEDVISACRHAGGNVLTEPAESPWGVRAVVADPDGHRVELSQKLPLTGVPTAVLEVYSTESNYAVIKPPGRNFPGAVIQGDSLSILCHTAQRVAEAVRDKAIDDEEFPYEVEDLLHSLLGRLLRYQQVLQKHGISLPYSPPVSVDDFIKLTPENDEVS